MRIRSAEIGARGALSGVWDGDCPITECVGPKVGAAGGARGLPTGGPLESGGSDRVGDHCWRGLRACTRGRAVDLAVRYGSVLLDRERVGRPEASRVPPDVESSRGWAAPDGGGCGVGEFNIVAVDDHGGVCAADLIVSYLGRRISKSS